MLGGRGKEEKGDRARSLEMGSCFDYLIRIMISNENENASFAFFNVIVIIIFFDKKGKNITWQGQRNGMYSVHY